MMITLPTTNYTDGFCYYEYRILYYYELRELYEGLNTTNCTN